MGALVASLPTRALLADPNASLNTLEGPVISSRSLLPTQFGDFQTPPDLANTICRFLAGREVRPSSVVEPTCGLGRFILAALDHFPDAQHLGVEINPTYVDSLRKSLAGRADDQCRLILASAFDIDWGTTLRELPEPILILGNPPWVTNAQVSAIGGSNVPPKTNGGRHAGLDALTGKSNFDVSEWLITRLIEAAVAEKRRGWLAMLCKTAVARRVLESAWKNCLPLGWAEMRVIDAQADFSAAVDACLLFCNIGLGPASTICAVFEGFDATGPRQTFGRIDGRIVADVVAYERWKHLEGENDRLWRSGVKHDCSKVMELRLVGDRFQNGLGETVDLENDFLYPMLKSSEIAHGRVDSPERLMLVPQRATCDDTEVIGQSSPRTWAYLQANREALDRRKSAIYRKRPPFSVFGVGDYSFTPWKVAVSGFYKRLHFATVGPVKGKPVVFDDTVYFLACRSESEARLIAAMLTSEAALGFFSAYLFRDAKRPITTELLRRLSLRALADELGLSHEFKAVSG